MQGLNKRKSMDKGCRKPVENHDTAAWANIRSQLDLSKVNVPDEVQVRNAKEFVDSNEK